MAGPKLPPSFNKQCQGCNKIINGPGDGVNPGKEVHHISRDAKGQLVILESGDADHPSNVSHGYCEDCTPIYIAQQQAMIEARRKRREAEQAEAKAREDDTR